VARRGTRPARTSSTHRALCFSCSLGLLVQSSVAAHQFAPCAVVERWTRGPKRLRRFPAQHSAASRAAQACGTCRQTKGARAERVFTARVDAYISFIIARTFAVEVYARAHAACTASPRRLAAARVAAARRCRLGHARRLPSADPRARLSRRTAARRVWRRATASARGRTARRGSELGAFLRSALAAAQTQSPRLGSSRLLRSPWRFRAAARGGGAAAGCAQATQQPLMSKSTHQ
jgi:hypothetical protein